MYVALMQGSRDDEHHVVDHVAVGAVVQELCQRLIRLQQQAGCSELLVWLLMEAFAEKVQECWKVKRGKATDQVVDVS